MMFRIRRYQVVPGKTEAFNDFFLTRLFPVQKRYGARLVGRFQTEDGLQIVAVWVYQSFDHIKKCRAWSPRMPIRLRLKSIDDRSWIRFLRRRTSPS